MKSKLKVLTAVIALFAGSSAALADGLAIGLKAGTLGVGVELTTNVVPALINVRLQGNGFDYSKTITDTQAVYDAKLKLQSAGLIADWYPLAGKFRISGGVYYNGNKFAGTATPVAGTITIGNTTYTTAQAGTVSANIDFNKVAPYVGIGWGDPVSSGSPLGFSFELGALYQGKPKSKVTATGPAVVAAALAAEQQQLDNALNNFKFYPVISLGINYKF